MPREILIANRHPGLRLNRRAVARVIHLLDANATAFIPLDGGNRTTKPPSVVVRCLPPGTELSVAFLTDGALAQLHADFLDDPTLTDVITFEGNPASGTAGEICISVDAAVRQISPSGRSAHRRSAAASSRFNAAFSTELTLYLVHGWLHLVGFDDLRPAKKRVMRRAEARALALLRSHEAVPDFAFRR